MPTLINNYREKTTVNKVKKFYSMMSQAYLMSVKDNEHADSWNVGNGQNSTTATQLASYFKPYLKIQKDCGTMTGCLGYGSSYIKFLNNVNDYCYDNGSQYYKMILMDGSVMWFRGVTTYCQDTSAGCAKIWYDVNGTKEPNTIGKDIFIFGLFPSGVVPLKSNDCAKNNKGEGCSSYIIRKSNMNYLH